MSNFKKISRNIQEIKIDNPKTPKKKLTWLNLNNAGKKEIDYLRKNYKFNIEHLRASFAKQTSQRPIIEKNSDYIFMILHFPLFIGNKVIAAEIDFFIGDGYLITLHNSQIESLDNLFNHIKKDPDSSLSYKLESSALLLYEILEKLVNYTYALLDKNDITIDYVEDMIFEQKQRKSVSEILNLKRNIINIRKIFQNHKNIIQKLMETENKLMPEDHINKYYILLLEHSRKIWQILDNQKEMIDALYATNESLMNYRISDIMKTLTIFSVIVFPLNLLAAIFGMNTISSMPFVSHPYGFWIIIILMLIGSLVMLIYFKKKKWL